MKKEIIKRTLSGMPIGITINISIALFISIAKQMLIVTNIVNGTYNTLPLFITQYIISAIIGAIAGGSSVIFEIESWSITKQTAIHFIVFSIPFIIASVIGGWLPINNGIGLFIFIVIFLLIYFSIWYFQYNKFKNEITQINKNL